MKRAFTRDNNNHLASALIPLAALSALSLGDRIGVSRDIDLGYAAQIKSGEQGTVDFISDSTGTVEVLMDLPHRGLHEWFNHIWLTPFETDDILGAIVLLGTLLPTGTIC